MRDSLVNNTWVDAFDEELNFTDSGYAHSYGKIGPVTFKYEIKDSIINYAYADGSSLKSTKPRFHKDSLVFLDEHINWANGCWRRQKQLSKSYHTFYNKRFLDKNPETFQKIKITFQEDSHLEVDSAGNIFYIAKGYGIDNLDLYGHYRGKLARNTTSTLNQIIEKEEPKLKRLSCRNSTRMSYHSTPSRVIYSTTYSDFPSSHYLDDLNKEEIKTFEFLLEAIDFSALEFQKFADGDSVAGVVLYKPTERSWKLIKCTPNYLTSYTDDEKTFYLYSASMDSIFLSKNAKSHSYAYNYFYFYSDTLLSENTAILLEPQEVSPNWFYRGRAFVKPKKMIFLKLQWFKPMAEGYRVITRSNPFWTRTVSPVKPRYPDTYSATGLFPNPLPKPYRTKFGLPYPFLRPDFQVAFEEYVLPDWEAYLKSQKVK